jgi:hypothetical protein
VLLETQAASHSNSDRMSRLSDFHSELTEQLLSQFPQFIGVNVTELLQKSLTSPPNYDQL